MSQGTNNLSGYIGADRFISDHLAQSGEVFKTKHSLEWFCRLHRERLIDSHQLIIRRGPCGNLYGPHFSAIALEILLESSLLTGTTQMAVTGNQDSLK